MILHYIGNEVLVSIRGSDVVSQSIVKGANVGVQAMPFFSSPKAGLPS